VGLGEFKEASHQPIIQTRKASCSVICAWMLFWVCTQVCVSVIVCARAYARVRVCVRACVPRAKCLESIPQLIPRKEADLRRSLAVKSHDSDRADSIAGAGAGRGGMEGQAGWGPASERQPTSRPPAQLQRGSCQPRPQCCGGFGIDVSAIHV